MYQDFVNPVPSLNSVLVQGLVQRITEKWSHGMPISIRCKLVLSPMGPVSGLLWSSSMLSSAYGILACRMVLDCNFWFGSNTVPKKKKNI